MSWTSDELERRRRAEAIRDAVVDSLREISEIEETPKKRPDREQRKEKTSTHTAPATKPVAPRYVQFIPVPVDDTTAGTIVAVVAGSSLISLIIGMLMI